MSLARGSSARLKYAYPALRTCTIRALMLARCASATSFSTCAGDFIPLWNASTQSARYWDGPYTIGLGDGVGVGMMVGVEAAFWPVHENDMRITAPATTARLMFYAPTEARSTWFRPVVEIVPGNSRF